MKVTTDLILRKAVFEDWRDLYERVWSHPETARHMLWNVTQGEEAAKARMERTIAFQAKTPHGYVVCRKSDDRPIGFAGMMEIRPGVFEDIGVALGPDYIGRGYGKQILHALFEIAFSQPGAQKFIGSCRAENEASRRLQLACGMKFTHTEPRVDERTGKAYTLEFYEKENDLSQS